MQAAIVARLKRLVPYLVMALIVPGGSLRSPLLWFYSDRHPKKE